MDKEYIERGVAVQALVTDYAYAAADLVSKLPKADVVEVKHSKWKYYHKQNIAVCMNCSFERDLDANFGTAISCPNCGAKMDA